jgi:GT2 family glycosyltransferase
MAGDTSLNQRTQHRISPALPVSVLAPPGLVSVLVPCCGQLEYTKLCVPSLLTHSRSPFELIFLDIGSLDGTAEYLAGVKAAATTRIEILRTPTDQGIKTLIGEALATARGEFIALLNNDAVVTELWLDQLIGLITMSPTVGMVGPMSNYAAPPQLVETVPYRIGPKKIQRLSGVTSTEEVLVDISAVGAFARQYREQNFKKWIEVDRLGGFCLLLKREVLTKIGSLEQWTDLSLFDSDILSLKARQKGFTLACCRDLFIHHFGTRTFAHGAPTPSTDQPVR